MTLSLELICFPGGVAVVRCSLSEGLEESNDAFDGALIVYQVQHQDQ